MITSITAHGHADLLCQQPVVNDPASTFRVQDYMSQPRQPQAVPLERWEDSHMSRSVPLTAAGRPHNLDLGQMQHQDQGGNPKNGLHGYHGLDGQIPLPLQEMLQHAIRPTHQHTQSVSTEDTAYDNDINPDAQDSNQNAPGRKKKTQGPSQANGEELRRLLRENEDRSLHDIATQVWHDQQGPKAEKSKQVFGMLWLRTHVVKRPNMSITRNKVYHAYVKKCTDHNIKHLNPASFGKLVHIIFEDLKTRRLGMRGLSKYHYVDLALIGDDGAIDAGSVAGDSSRMSEGPGRLPSVGPQRLKSKLSADTAYFSPTESNPQPLFTDTQRADFTAGVIWTQAAAISDFDHAATVKAVKPLRLNQRNSDAQRLDEENDLPSIEAYIPPGTDRDAIDSLVLVYRSHYRLAIDNFQYCRTVLVRDGFKSFLGQLTRPGLDLLTHDSIADWIRQCDWLKYQSMVPMLDKLLLMDVPVKGLAHIENVAQNLCHWITTYFSSQPPHIVQAMLDPARVFAGVLERFLRVQRATRDVADTLEMVESRNKLWEDWVTASNPLAVVSNTLLFHDQGHKALLHLLTKEVRFLLAPDYDRIPTAGTLFDASGRASDFQLRELERDGGPEIAPIVGRLFRFLSDLPMRFNLTNSRVMLNHVEVVTGNVTRNLALGGVKDLGKWWQIKLFIDEAVYWLAERGGMMESWSQSMAGQIGASLPITHMAVSFEPVPDFDFSRPATAHSVAVATDANAPLVHGHPSPDFPNRTPAALRSATLAIRSPSRGTPNDKLLRKRRHSASTVGEEELGDDKNDDSGIAMGMDDDFGDHKYTSFVQGVHGSDPADVVVC